MLLLDSPIRRWSPSIPYLVQRSFITGPHACPFLPDGSASSLRKGNTNSSLVRLSHNHRLGLAVSQSRIGCISAALPKIGKRFQRLEEAGFGKPRLWTPDGRRGWSGAALGCPGPSRVQGAFTPGTIGSTR